MGRIRAQMCSSVRRRAWAHAGVGRLIQIVQQRHLHVGRIRAQIVQQRYL